MRSGGTVMLLRTGSAESAFVSRGVTWGFLPAFWGSGLASLLCDSHFTAVYRPIPMLNRLRPRQTPCRTGCGRAGRGRVVLI